MTSKKPRIIMELTSCSKIILKKLSGGVKILSVLADNIVVILEKGGMSRVKPNDR